MYSEGWKLFVHIGDPKHGSWSSILQEASRHNAVCMLLCVPDPMCRHSVYDKPPDEILMWMEYVWNMSGITKDLRSDVSR